MFILPGPRSPPPEGIAAFATEEGCAVLLSTHLIEDVARISDRVVVMREGAPPVADDLETLRASCNRYVIRLEGVLDSAQPLQLPRGCLLLERDPRALTVIAHGAPEHFEAELDASLPFKDLERRKATLKEAFACLSAPQEAPR